MEEFRREDGYILIYYEKTTQIYGSEPPHTSHQHLSGKPLPPATWWLITALPLKTILNMTRQTILIRYDKTGRLVGDVEGRWLLFRK